MATATATATATEIAPTATTTAIGMAPTATANVTVSEPAPIPEKYMHKNRLQEFAVRRYEKWPIYNVELEGEYHLPKFRCTVEVGGQQFSSSGSFSRKKEAEQDAARVAYETLVASTKDDPKEMLELIDQEPVFCKSILHEFTDKTKTTRPSYSVVCLEKPMTLFIASVVFDGNNYTGEYAANKKDAKQKAARAVIKSILATGNTCMMDIIKSKKKFVSAIRSSGNSPAATFSPIKFTRPVAYSAYDGPDHVAPVSQNESSSLAVQGHTIVPAVEPSANPSAKAVTGSKKRKGRAEGSAKEH